MEQVKKSATKAVKNKVKELVFNPDIMAAIVFAGDKFVFEPAGEKMLNDWLDFVESVNAAHDKVKEVLLSTMKQNSITKVEGGTINLSSRVFGEKYEITDRDIAMALGFAKTEITVIPKDNVAVSDMAAALDKAGFIVKTTKNKETKEDVPAVKVKADGSIIDKYMKDARANVVSQEEAEALPLPEGIKLKEREQSLTIKRLK